MRLGLYINFLNKASKNIVFGTKVVVKGGACDIRYLDNLQNGRLCVFFFFEEVENGIDEPYFCGA